MTRKYVLWLLAAAFLILPAQRANAERGIIGTGVRFTWENYETPAMAYGNTSREPVEGDVNGDGDDEVIGYYDVDMEAMRYGGPSFGGELIIQPIPRLAIDVGLDISFFKHTIFPSLIQRYRNGGG